MQVMDLIKKKTLLLRPPKIRLIKLSSRRFLLIYIKIQILIEKIA